MNLKIFIYGFFFMIFAVSCNKQITNEELLASKTNVLKADAIGRTYYVSKTGSDSNSGTSESPFLTIQHAADIVSAGDIVTVRDGIYSGAVTITRSGTSGAPIILQSENQYGAIIDGSSSTGVIFDNAASYVTFSGFTIRNFVTEAIGCHGNAASYITIEKCKIYDIGRYSTSTDQGLDGIYLTPLARHWTITRNLFYNIGRTGPDSYYLNKDHMLYVGTGAGDTYHTFSYNICLNSSGCQVTSGGNHESYLNNVFAWRTTNSQGGGGFFAMDAGVSYCTIANNQFYQPATGYALQAGGTPTGWVVKNNMIYGGSMWSSADAARLAVMAGGNFGRTDCENGEVNPLFVSAVRANIPNVDFTLQTTSPAINAGVNVGLTTDFLKNTLVGLPDMGAYESIGSATTVTPVAVTPVIVAAVVVAPVAVTPVVIAPVVVEPVAVTPVVVAPVVVEPVAVTPVVVAPVVVAPVVVEPVAVIPVVATPVAVVSPKATKKRYNQRRR